MLGKSLLDELKSSSSSFIGAGYAPAHITGIFEIYRSNNDPLKCGSRGLGFCIDKGVTTYVVIRKDTKKRISVFFNGSMIQGKTTKTTIDKLINNIKANIQVFSFTDLPMSQGFGLSGAGALSCAIALNSALKLNRQYYELVDAAHYAEVVNNSGLGDVVAQATGGIVFRERAGASNFGITKGLNLKGQKQQIIICSLDTILKTSEIISNKTWIQRINRAGNKYLKTIEKISDMSDLIEYSFKFALESELISEKVMELIQKIHQQKLGFASMIMLGNSIFGIGKPNKRNKINKFCREFGKTYMCKIDQHKAKAIL